MARSAGILVLALVVTGGVLAFVNDTYPVRSWLAWPMLRIAGWQILLNLAWLCGGVAITLQLAPRGLPSLDRLCIGVAVGVAAFAFSLYVLGALGLFNATTAVALPVLFVFAGGVPTVRWWRTLPTSPAGGAAVPFSRLGLAATLYGTVWTVVLYLGLLNPDTVSYDARWMHLCIAQDYAREGRLVPFPGDWVKAYPHLISVVQTWNFLVPGFSEQPLRWMLALHTEFSLFLWTLVGVAAAARWMIGNGATRGAWAAYFLFPGIFIYDGNLQGSADHALAFFALPMFLLSVRVVGQSSARPYALWGLVAGAALITKYQAVYFLIPLTALLVVLTAWVAWRERTLDVRGLLRGAGLLVAGMLVASAPHFLKNIYHHGNPFYPLMQQVFTHSHPTVRDAPVIVQHILADYAWRAPEKLGPRLGEALTLMFTFPFKPHYSFLNYMPSFGFAFTAALAVMVLIRQNGRLWIGALASLGAVFMWGFTYRVDRNLQTLLPLLVATSAAIFVRGWHSGRLARVGIAVLVSMQIIWATDLALASSDRINAAFALIATGRDNRASTRFVGYSPDYIGVGKALPPNAVVLLHHYHPQLGINRRIYLDWVGFQGSIDYRPMKTPRDLYNRLRSLGITHIVYLPGHQASPCRQEEVLFDSFVTEVKGTTTRIGPFAVLPMPAQPPRDRPPLQVATFGLGSYRDGLYHIDGLGTYETLPPALQHYAPPEVPALGARPLDLIAQSDAVLMAQPVPDAQVAQVLSGEFQAAETYPGLTVYVRTATSTRR